MAEAMASLATAVTVLEHGSVAMGLSNSTSFLRPITAGTVHAHATRLHRGRTTWVWDVRFSDDADRLCAVTRMTIAVRPRALSAGADRANHGRRLAGTVGGSCEGSGSGREARVGQRRAAAAPPGRPTALIGTIVCAAARASAGLSA